MAIRVSHSKPAVPSATVVAFEQELGVSLPEDYRAFLLRHNGGCVDPRYFRIQRAGPPWSFGELQYLFSFSPGDSLDLAWNRKTYQGRVPAELLGIGCDPGGNLLCLALAGEQRGPSCSGTTAWRRPCRARQSPTTATSCS